jgi:hypothetical protein
MCMQGEWILSSKLDRQYQLIHIFCSYAVQISSDAIYGLNRDFVDEEDMGTIIETESDQISLWLHKLWQIV